MLCLGITIFIIGLIITHVSLSPEILEKEYIKSFQSNKWSLSLIGAATTTVGFIIIGVGLFLKLI